MDDLASLTEELKNLMEDFEKTISFIEPLGILQESLSEYCSLKQKILEVLNHAEEERQEIISLVSLISKEPLKKS